MVDHLSKNPSKSRILIVEDDKSIRETLREALVAEGYAVEVCKTGDEAQTRIFSQFDTSKKLDLVVLDLMLPNLNGIELCRRVRKNNIKTPILIVSAKDSESDRVLGLEVGADDYLIKPFGLNELIARCRAILRRSETNNDQTQDSSQVLSFKNISLYKQEYRVTKNNKEINLAPKEYKIMELFLQNPKRVWSRGKHLERIWGIVYVGDSKTVDVHIRWIREKIEEDASAPSYIKTVRGFGYKFG